MNRLISAKAKKKKEMSRKTEMNRLNSIQAAIENRGAGRQRNLRHNKGKIINNTIILLAVRGRRTPLPVIDLN